MPEFQRRWNITMEELPPFDPKAKCIKCGWSIPDPVAPPPKFISGAGGPPGAGDGPPGAEKKKEDAAEVKPAPKKAEPAKPPAEKPGLMYQAPTPPPQPPNVTYCNGEECPWDDDHQGVDEHMHQICDTCGFEWLSKPLTPEKPQ